MLNYNNLNIILDGYLLMSKYPFVYFLRDNQFSEIDTFFEENKDKLD